MLIRNKSNNIVVAKGHGYTVEKVKKAMDFINHTGRNTTVQEWVEMYNYLKDANDSVKGCKPCAAGKYTAAVRNYAKYGYLTLINEGHKPEEFMTQETKVQEPIENEEKRIVLEEKVEEPKVEDAVIENVKEALQEEPTEEPKVEEGTSDSEVLENAIEEVVEEPKPKRGRKSSK